MRPIIEKLQRAGQEIYIVEQGSNPRLVQQYSVGAYPTMVIFNQGTEVKTYIGVVTAKAITEYLEPWTPDNTNLEVDYDFVDGPSVDYKLW
jgi:thioredoxin-like negative regulator of GroEL